MNKILTFILLFLASAVRITAQEDTQITLVGSYDDAKVRQIMESNTIAFFHTINDAVRRNVTPEFNEKMMTPDCIRTVCELWDNSQFSCPLEKAKGHIAKILNADLTDKNAAVVEVRDIPIIQLKALDEPLTMNLAFTKKGIINGVTIGLSPVLIRSIMKNKLSGVDEVRRQIVASFLENFRTAYNRKDIEFLEKVYSDDALIITGRTGSSKIVSSRNDNGVTFKSERTVQFVKQTKQEYLTRLRGVFSKNNFINVDFDNIDIHLHPNKDFNGNIYCVALDQSWTSATKNGKQYHDDGYLFLIIDFQNQDKPLIQVRVWQPKDDLQKENRLNETNLGLEFNR